jgi:hypothetical protein
MYYLFYRLPIIIITAPWPLLLELEAPMKPEATPTINALLTMTDEALQ